MSKYIIDLLKNKYIYEKRKKNLVKGLKGKETKIVLLDTSIHNNIGDACIALAEILFLEKMPIKLVEIDQEECAVYLEDIKRYIKKEDIVVIHGGGNLGNVWLHHELTRRKIIQMFPGNLIVSMPQTFYFTRDSVGEKERKESCRIYNKHQNLYLFAREKVSYELMKKNFGENTRLVPDIVLSINKDYFKMPEFRRDGVLFCMRRDAEKSISQILEKKMKEYFISIGKKIVETDMVAKGEIRKNDREEIIKKKLEEFKKAEVVITDRLHGMIFAFLMNTPCLVFANNNHKIQGVYEWIKSCGYIRFVSEHLNKIEEIESEYQKVISVKGEKINFNEQFRTLEKIFYR